MDSKGKATNLYANMNIFNNPYRNRPLLNLLERFDFFIESHADYVVAVMLILMIVFICLCGGADAFKDDIDIKPNIERYKDYRSLENQNIYHYGS